MSRPGHAVFTTRNMSEAEQVRSFLEAAGVACMVRGESLATTHGVPLIGKLGRIEVVVADEDEARARDLLAAADAGQFRLDEDSDFEPP
jgi:putative signal transducing protein